MDVEELPLDSLVQDPANVRRHDGKNIDTIKGSLARFGQQKPIVVDANGVIIAGNGTWEAARALDWHTVKVVRSEFAGSDRTAYAIADNRTAELAEWDDEALAEQLSALAIEDDELLAATGFDESELSALVDGMAGSDDIEEDEAPEPPADPVTKPGDLWVLGEHRWLCGDSTVAGDARLVTGDSLADMLLTDPPYGVSYVGGTDDALTLDNDDISEGDLAGLVRDAFGLAEKVTRPGAYWYATVPPGPLHLVFAADWKKRGILRQILVWNKDSMVLGHSEYHYKHEPILFGWKPGPRHKNSDRTRTTVWDVQRPNASREHPTMKPVALWAIAMGDGSIAGEAVFDPFLGSGTTLIAAEQLNRRCYGIEISPAYCDVIVERWQNLTGGKATRTNAAT